MIVEVKQYNVYNGFGDLVVSGDAKVCAKALGMTTDYFRKASLNEKYKKWNIVDTTTTDRDKCISTNEQSAIKAWDDFCEPIRKKYGIPVYRGRK